MQRYLKVRGQRGKLVANPRAIGSSPRRYAGQRYVAKDPPPAEHAQRYEPCEEVLIDDPSLRKAAKRDELDILAEGEGERPDAVTWRELQPTAPEPPAAPEPEKEIG